MLDWLTNINKEHPEFWIKYISKFKEKPNRFVVFTTKTLESSLENNVLLSIGAIGVINSSICVADSFETIISQYNYFKQNKIKDTFLVESKAKKKVEAEAIQHFIEFIENSVLIGHHVDFDVEMINNALEKLGCERLKNEALDIDVMHQKLSNINSKKFSLEELCEIYKIPASENDSAIEEAYNIALIFLKLKSRLGIN